MASINYCSNCDICSFKCGNKQDYTRHILTRKHKLLTNPNIKMPLRTYICDCGKEYKHMSSLCNHKRTCKPHNTIDDTPNASLNKDKDMDIKVLSNTIFELVKQNNEFKQLLIEQNQKMIRMFSEK